MRYNTKILFSFLILGLFFSLSCAQVVSEKSDVSTKIGLVSDKAKESTVRLVGFPGGGTGFFVAPDKIATNFHVAAGTTIGPITAKLSHKETIWLVEGVAAFDAKSDIAILKIKGEGISLPLADIDKLQIGEKVFLAGYPNLNDYKVVGGVVKDIRSSDKWLMTTVEAYPGNSGSPMLNGKGEAIGIHVGHGYDARPSSAIKALLESSTSTELLGQWRQRKEVRSYFHYMRGRQKYHDGNAEEAIIDFNKAIEVYPYYAEAYIFRAKTKLMLNDRQGATDDYNQALKLNPDDHEIHKKLEEIKTIIEVQTLEDGTVVILSHEDGKIIRRTIERSIIE